MLSHAVGYVDQWYYLGFPVSWSSSFWVPRAVWSSKPIGSGDFVATEYVSGTLDDF